MKTQEQNLEHKELEVQQVNGEKNERLNLEEFKQKRLDLGLADYLEGGRADCSIDVGLGTCIPCENYCHDK
jgi:hypothetical protein